MDAFIRAGGLPQYYRCEVNNKSQEDWYAEGEKSKVKGVLFLFFGIMCQILYLPCLVVMTQKDLAHLNVYKLLFYVTVLDIISLTSDFDLTGYYFLTGAVYCNFPVFNYIWGTLCVSVWCGCCINCFFLVFTRLIDLMNPELHNFLFEGKRIYFTLLLMTSYIGFFILYTRPTVFNSRLETWMWDPVIWVDGRDYKQFTSPYFVINNFGTVSATVFLTLAFFVIYGYKMKKTYDFKMDAKQFQLFAQSVFLCLCNIGTAVCYTYIQFIDANPTIVLVALTAWQFSSVCGLFVFYGMNKTVRNKVFYLVGIKSKKKAKTISVQSKSATFTI